MSVFGNIVSAIFGSKHAASVTAAAGPSAPSSSAGSATATGLSTLGWDVRRFGGGKADLES